MPGRRHQAPLSRRVHRQSLAGQDIPAVASALTWLGERLYYLAATSTPPFDNQDTLISTLLSIWTSVLYQARTGPGGPAPPADAQPARFPQAKPQAG